MKAIFDITLEQDKASKNTYKKPEATSDMITQALINDKKIEKQLIAKTHFVPNLNSIKNN